MSYYIDLKGSNHLSVLKPLLKAGMLSLRGSDNKYVANLEVQYNSPWVHTKSDYRINCFLWKEIIFHGIVEKHIPPDRRFVPMGCQQCYKVVVRPKTLKQLFALEKIQAKMGHPSKCGIELRKEVFGNYGGYFYNRGLEEGLACYKKVRSAISMNSILGKEIKVILKRGCTEMEHCVGPSDKWLVSKEQIDLEVMINNNFVDDLPVLTQSENVKNDVRQRWIEHAYSIGDETMYDYNDGQPLYPEYVTYHHLANKKGKQNAVKTR
jgi:hypothetical protein